MQTQVNQIEGFCQLDITFHCETKSESNLREKTKYRIKRHKSQKVTVWGTLHSISPKLTIITPCKITLTRYAARKMDFDNLVGCFKRIRDSVAEYIHPDLPAGKADDDPNIEWVYKQTVDGKKRGMVRIEIYS